MEKANKTCCVFGHRKISEKDSVKMKLAEIFENLITTENVETFFVGSRSEFDDLCRDVIGELRNKYPKIKRIYIRAEYPYISDEYEQYLLERCEGTYFPERVQNAGKAIYVERNFEMIDKSDICVTYFKDSSSNSDLHLKSGTAMAYNYALKKQRQIINLA